MAAMLDELTTEANEESLVILQHGGNDVQLDMQVSLTPHGGICTCCEVKACFGTQSKWERKKRSSEE